MQKKEGIGDPAEPSLFREKMSIQSHARSEAEDLIRVAAYYHYEDRLRHGEQGTDLSDWLCAEAEVMGRTQDKPVAARVAAAVACDLTAIKGVGKVLADRLRQAGHASLEKIAAWTSSEIEEIDATLKLRGRIERDGWVGQARALIGH